MTKSGLRLFNMDIKDCCGNGPYYLRAFFQSQNPLKPIIRYVFRRSPWDNDQHNSCFMLKSNQKFSLLVGKDKITSCPSEKGMGQLLLWKAQIARRTDGAIGLVQLNSTLKSQLELAGFHQFFQVIIQNKTQKN